MWMLQKAPPDAQRCEPLAQKHDRGGQRKVLKYTGPRQRIFRSVYLNEKTKSTGKLKGRRREKKVKFQYCLTLQ